MARVKGFRASHGHEQPMLIKWLLQGYFPGQEEVAKQGAIPKMLALLEVTSETVKERAAEALLVSDGAPPQSHKSAVPSPADKQHRCAGTHDLDSCKFLRRREGEFKMF